MFGKLLLWGLAFYTAGIVTGLAAVYFGRTDAAEPRPGTAISDEEMFERTARAIALVESGGDPQAVGAASEIGVWQILPDYWTDATGFLGVSWPYRDAKDLIKAKEAVRAYTQHYAAHYRLPWTPETVCRLHKGGPRGWKKASTIPYWHKVRTILLKNDTILLSERESQNSLDF